MKHVDHTWVRTRLAAWRAGLLPQDETEDLVSHLQTCQDCQIYEDAFRIHPDQEAGSHVPASLVAGWPQAQRTLRGLERELVRLHLERCAECRQDIELLGFEPTLDVVPELEPAAPLADVTTSPEPAPWLSVSPTHRVSDSGRIIRVVWPEPRTAWWNRALAGWAAVATAAAVIAIVAHARRPVVEGVPPELAMTIPAAASSHPPDESEGVSLRFASRPRSLSGPTHGSGGGKLTVIPVVGPVYNLALTVNPLNVPDTSLVTIALLGSEGDTLFRGGRRQWEFFPKRVLVIEGAGGQPFEPGQYALELVSLIAGEDSPTRRISRYRFELRPR